MKNSKYNRLLILPYIILSLLPLMLFFFDGIYEIISESDMKDYIVMDIREFILLIKTTFYALAVVSLTVLFGTSMGLALMTLNERRRKIILLLLLMLMPLPFTIHTMMWMGMFSVINEVTAMSLSLTGWPVSVFVQFVALVPLATVLIYDSMKKVPQNLIDVGKIQASDQKVFLRVWLPQCKPGIMIAGIIVFLLSFNDYSVPSSFAVNTFSMDIFAKYSISLKAVDAFMASLPMILVTMILIVPLAKNIEKQFFSSTLRSEDRFIKHIKVIEEVFSKVVMMIAFLLIVLPMILLVSNVDFTEFNLIRDGGWDILATLWISFSATIVALPIMLLAALGLGRKKHWSAIGYSLIIFPALVPPSLVGAALINFWNVPLFRPIYTSTAMASLAVMIRFMPVGILVIKSGLNRITDDMLSVAHITSGDIKHIYFRIIIPLITPALLIASVFVFLMGIGELGATVMVLPPGISTITVRIFGYLHYGATELIAEMCVVVIATMLIIEVMIYKGSSIFFKTFRKGSIK